MYHLNKLESPSPKAALCQVRLKLAQQFRRRDENVKSLQTDGETDGRTDRRRTTGDQKSSVELKTLTNRYDIFSQSHGYNYFYLVHNIYCEYYIHKLIIEPSPFFMYAILAFIKIISTNQHNLVRFNDMCFKQLNKFYIYMNCYILQEMHFPPKSLKFSNMKKITPMKLYLSYSMHPHCIFNQIQLQILMLLH